VLDGNSQHVSQSVGDKQRPWIPTLPTLQSFEVQPTVQLNLLATTRLKVVSTAPLQQTFMIAHQS